MLRPRMLAVVVGLLLLMPAVHAAQAKDSISGNWGRDGRTYLELKLEEPTTVTGTAIWRDGTGQYEHRAPIKSGTFDARTGGFKLQGDATLPDGAPAVYEIVGKVADDTVTGTFKLGDRSGQFSFKRL